MAETGGTVHVAGAGLAGLSAALALRARNVPVRVWEAAGHAGGRCRSFHDRVLDRVIDNGNHLVLSGNDGVRRYLTLAGAEGALEAGEPAYPFVDLAMSERWTVRLDRGLSGLTVPGSRLAEYLDLLRLAPGRTGRTVAEVVRGRGALWRRFWEPLTVAVLNAPPDQAEARLLWRVFRETLLRGPSRARPMFAPEGLGPALIDPAAAALDERLCLGTRVTDLALEGDRIAAFRAGDRTVTLGPRDALILALPLSQLRAAVPGMALPAEGQPIANAHFVLPDAPKDAPPLLGVLGALVQWIFVRGDVVSLTISAAADVETTGREALLDRLWSETAAALGIETKPLARRLIVERRATFDQSPEGVALRPSARTGWRNLFLAGDFTDTGLPATIEGAIRSGETAAGHAARLAAGAAAG